MPFEAFVGADGEHAHLALTPVGDGRARIGAVGHVPAEGREEDIIDFHISSLRSFARLAESYAPLQRSLRREAGEVVEIGGAFDGGVAGRALGMTPPRPDEELDDGRIRQVELVEPGALERDAHRPAQDAVGGAGVADDGDSLTRVRGDDVLAGAADALGEGGQRLATGDAGVLGSPDGPVDLLILVRAPVRDRELGQPVVNAHIKARDPSQRLGGLARAAHGAGIDGGKRCLRRAQSRRPRPAGDRVGRGGCGSHTNRHRHAPVHGAPGRGGRGQSPGRTPLPLSQILIAGQVDVAQNAADQGGPISRARWSGTVVVRPSGCL